MSAANVLVNDTVRIKVHFIDINSTTQEQVDVSPATVSVKIYNSDDQLILSDTADPEVGSTSRYYYDYTPSVAGVYKISFLGILADATMIAVDQQLYVSTSSSEYKPSVTLRSTETIVFSADIMPLFIDPEEVKLYFPEASLLEIAEIIHNYSLEVKKTHGLKDDDDGSNLPFNVTEYIKAASCCDLSRTYGYGGDDEQSVRIGDLQISNRNFPRTVVTRGNAVTWCQIATALRSEMIASKVGMRAVQPKGIPTETIITSPVDPQTGSIVYLSDTTQIASENFGIENKGKIPSRRLKKYD